MYNLTLSFTPEPHPFPNEAGSKYEEWGIIKIDICGDQQQVVQNVVTCEWDVLELIEWFHDNHAALLDHELPDFVRGLHPVTDSVASVVEKYYDNLTEINDTEIDHMSRYNHAHNLKFGFRGQTHNSIYIAKVYGEMTISTTAEPAYSYPIDIKEFSHSIQDLYTSFGDKHTNEWILKEWDRGNDLDWRTLTSRLQNRWLTACLHRTGIPKDLKPGRYEVDGKSIETRSGLYCLLGEVFFGKRGYFGQDLDGLHECILKFQTSDVKQSTVSFQNFITEIRDESTSLHDYTLDIAAMFRDAGFSVEMH